MELKWKKNAHILIHPDNCHLRADKYQNIRRVSFFGRTWFKIKDWLNNGAETETLNKAIKETLEQVAKKLFIIKKDLEVEIKKLPDCEEIIYWDDYSMEAFLKKSIRREDRQTVLKISDLTDRLLLGGKPRFLDSSRYPKGRYCECYQALPQAIGINPKMSTEIKIDPFLIEIKNFFTFDFIEGINRKKLVQNRINSLAHNFYPV